LAALYDQHGQRWAIIARSLDGRTDQQCMGRWRRHVDPSVARGNWTLEEDEKLTKEHETLGAKWAVIAREIEGRTAQQCRARFYQLKQIQRDEEEEKKKKKKKKTADGEENDGEKKEEEKEQQQNQEKKRKKRKMSAEENTDSSNENNNNNNNNNNNKEKKNKKKINANDAKIVVAKGSFLSEAFPPITASMEQISLLEENDAMKKESLEPIQFNQKTMAMSANVTTTSTKKRKPTNGNENGENKNGNENRSFAQDPSKSITEPSTPEEEAEKPPTARTSRSTKKTTLPTLFSAATKRKPSSATAAPARSNAKGSTTKTAKPKTSRRRTPTNRGRRTVIKNDAFRGNQDDTLTLLCAAADRLEGLFSSTTQRRSF
tara:strand:+ start:283 stop:1407 length:1125 start_codon:yes stop_codon:yes gene_type:complete